jgi:hypothetical protein
MKMSVKEAKASARRLRSVFLSGKFPDTHSGTLEVFAFILTGAKNWNTLRPLLQADTEEAPNPDYISATEGFVPPDTLKGAQTSGDFISKIEPVTMWEALEGGSSGTSNPDAALEEARRLLVEADDLYTHYGLVASPDYGHCGRWINNVRDFIDKNGAISTRPEENSSALRVAVEDTLEWLETGKVDGVGFDEEQIVDSLKLALGQGTDSEVRTPKAEISPKAKSRTLGLRHHISKLPASRYPLINNGQFDFVKSGRFVTGHFSDLAGTVEDIPGCVANVGSVERDSRGDIEIEYTGDTDVAWDNQRTQRDDFGNRLWVDSEEWDTWVESRCVIVPEEFDSKGDWSELPIREPLVQAIALYLSELPGIEAALKQDYLKTVGSAEKVVGFSMTPAEDERVTQVVLPELLRLKRGG